jgi:hypothetical protein
VYEEEQDGAGGGAASGAEGEAAAAAAAKEDAPDAKALAAEVERLRGQVAEKEEAVRFWHGEAKKTAPKSAATPETPDEDEDKTDLLDLIATKGAKGLTGFLAKKGFVSGDEVDRRVNERATQMVRESKLIEEFPELSDQKSEFFKSTAVEYRELVNQGVPKQVAMGLAAKNVRLAALEAGEGDTKKTPKPDAEAERVRRIKAQGGDKGRKGADREESDELTPMQREIADAMGVSHDAYKKRAKEGVVTYGR